MNEIVSEREVRSTFTKDVFDYSKKVLLEQPYGFINKDSLGDRIFTETLFSNESPGKHKKSNLTSASV